MAVEPPDIDWLEHARASRSARTRGENPLPGSIGSFYWNGGFGTTFQVDPKQQLVFILMTQVPWSAFHPYRKGIRYLAYQAMTDLN